MNMTRILPLFCALLTAPLAYAGTADGPNTATLAADAEQQADDLLERAREAIDNTRYDRAVADLDRVIALKTPKSDAALYWKAYSLSKLGQREEALTTVSELMKQFANSRWIKDAKALE